MEMEEARTQMRKIRGLALYELVVPRSQLTKWKLFVTADMEMTLAVRPTKRKPRQARRDETLVPRRPGCKERRTISETVLGMVC